jgi:hypothetical protein
MRQILKEGEKVHPGLIDYWLQRTEDSCRRGQMDKGGFAEQSIALVSRTAALSAWADRLRSAIVSLAEANAKHAAYAYEAFDKPQEIAASYKSNRIPAKWKAVRDVVEGMLSSTGVPDLAGNEAWKRIHEFLLMDMDTQRGLVEREYSKSMDTRRLLRKVFWEGKEKPAPWSMQFEQLEKMYWSISDLRVKLYEKALGPGVTPMGFLENDSGDFIALQMRFDRELARFLISPAAETGNSLGISGVESAYALYPMRNSLERREDLLRGGSWTQSLHLLADEIGRGFYLAAGRERPYLPRDPDSGYSMVEPANHLVARNVDLINNYRERWIKDGKPPSPLYAAIEVDDQGLPVWRSGGWLLWQWITSEDLDDLTVDGRVIDSLGRRWLLPAGALPKSVKSLKDVSSSNAREIIVAIDPAGRWKHIGEKNR